ATALSSLAVGDFNRDGNPDLVATGPLLFELAVFLGNGDGTFRPRVDYSVPQGSAVIVADFNEDGKLDLAVAHGSAGSVSKGVAIFPGNGDGTFEAPKPGGSFLPDVPMLEFAIADF